jgi:hypothetical protein
MAQKKLSRMAPKHFARNEKTLLLTDNKAFILIASKAM